MEKKIRNRCKITQSVHYRYFEYERRYYHRRKKSERELKREIKGKGNHFIFFHHEIETVVVVPNVDVRIELIRYQVSIWSS